ncbi:uncharacterized protein LOC142027137 [Buteo buteo]|uniref:uncharacterized protein LOC142027137 n=1 Tax=Buteo buteo TaxID=30397 RepID=UPI003EBEDF75
MLAPAFGLPDVSKPFLLYSHEKQGIALGILAQNLGPYRWAVAYLSKQLDTTAKGWPGCLWAVAAVILNTQETRKFTLGQKMTVLVSHTVSTVLEAKGGHWLSPQRFLRYQAILVEQDDVEIVVTNTANPASFLSGNTGEPVHHDCLETIEATYASRPDLKDSPMENGETWFTDGSSYILNGNRHAGYTITTSQEVIESGALPMNTSAQKAEIIALTRALELAQGKVVNIYTDSKYAFGVVHAHGAIWKERGLLNSQGKNIKHAEEILKLLEAVQLPKKVAIMHIKAHQKVSSDLEKGNELADREAKQVARKKVKIEGALIPDRQISLKVSYRKKPGTTVGRTIPSTTHLLYCNQNQGTERLDSSHQSEKDTQNSMESHHKTRWTLSFYAVIWATMGTRSITWDGNMLVQLHESIAKIVNHTDCWICSHFPKGLRWGYPVIATVFSNTSVIAAAFNNMSLTKYAEIPPENLQWQTDFSKLWNETQRVPCVQRCHLKNTTKNSGVIRQKRTSNPPVERPTSFHSFVRWLIPSLGASELEKALVNLSATMEIINNATIDAIKTLQEETTSLGKMVLQIRLGLDALRSARGPVHSGNEPVNYAEVWEAAPPMQLRVGAAQGTRGYRHPDCRTGSSDEELGSWTLQQLGRPYRLPGEWGSPAARAAAPGGNQAGSLGRLCLLPLKVVVG